MKRNTVLSLLFICLMTFNGNVMAQDDNDAKTLFGNNTSLNVEDLGFFIAPAYGFTQMDGSNTSLFNLRAGLNFKDKITLGGYFTTSLNEIQPESETFPNVYMDYWSVGGFAEYTVLSKNIFHVTIPVYVGYGEVQMDNESGDAGLGEQNFFQVEPSALLEINLHKYVRFNLGAGYRFVEEMEYRNFSESEISGVTGYVGLKFGLFR